MDDVASIAESGVGQKAPPRRTLVMWSGGVDSTYALWRLAMEGGGALYSHHVRIESIGDEPAARRARLESDATAALRTALVEELDAGSGIEHGESAVAFPSRAGADSRAAIIVFHGARIMASLGFTPRDRLVLGANADVDPGWNPDTAAFALRRMLVLRLLRAAAECDDVPRLVLLEPLPSKRRMLASLPARLREHVASCLEPRDDGEGRLRPCGACAKCLWRAAQDRSPCGGAALPARHQAPASRRSST